MLQLALPRPLKEASAPLYSVLPSAAVNVTVPALLALPFRLWI